MADQSNSEYAENLSHELLTPLAVIRSKVELLIQSPNLSEVDLKNLDSIMKNVDRMSRLNKAIILLSKIDNEVYEDISTVNVCEIISDSLDNFEDQIRKKKLQIRFEKIDEPTLQCNQTLMEILIMNLIKNAIYHCKANTQIAIVSERNGIKIQNAAKGPIAENIFDRFVTESANDHSLGLGLSIVSKISELYDFELTHRFENEIFELTLKF